MHVIHFFFCLSFTFCLKFSFVVGRDWHFCVGFECIFLFYAHLNWVWRLRWKMILDIISRCNMILEAITNLIPTEMLKG